MEASFECFARKGIIATTMRDISAQAGLTDRYFYEAFRNTRDAFDAVNEWQRGQLVARVIEAMGPVDKQIQPLARAGLRAFYTFIREDPRRAQVLLIDAFSADQQAAGQGQRILDQYVTLISDFSEQIYPQLNKRFNIKMVVWGLLSMAIHVGVVWAREGFKQPIGEVIDYNLYAWEGLEARVNGLLAESRRARESGGASVAATAAGARTRRRKGRA